MDKPRYKDKRVNAIYEAYLKVDPKGVRRGSSMDSEFLNGYHGVRRKLPRGTFAYAAYMAGKQVRQNQDKL